MSDHETILEASAKSHLKIAEEEILNLLCLSFGLNETGDASEVGALLLNRIRGKVECGESPPSLTKRQIKLVDAYADITKLSALLKVALK